MIFDRNIDVRTGRVHRRFQWAPHQLRTTRYNRWVPTSQFVDDAGSFRDADSGAARESWAAPWAQPPFRAVNARREIGALTEVYGLVQEREGAAPRLVSLDIEILVHSRGSSEFFLS